MSNFVRILIDSDPKTEIDFKVGFNMEDFKDVTVEFKKNKEDCMNLSLSELENLSYDDARRLLQAVLSSHRKEKETQEKPIK